MNEITDSASLPVPIGLALSALLFAGLALWLRRVPDWTTRYLILAIFVRNVMSAFPDYTLMSVGGLSINAAVSIAIVSMGILILPPKRFLSKEIVPVYFIILVVVISAVANRHVMDGIDVIVKWMYFAVLVLLVTMGAERHGLTGLASRLLPAFLPPIVFQAASIALGVVKAGENDGSLSYIGGFNHESGMATCLLALLFVVAIARITVPLVKPLLLIAASVGLVLADYRTGMMAAAPIAMAALTAQSIRAFSPRQRILVSLLVVPVAALVFTSVASSFAERMADLATVSDRWDLIFQSPAVFTDDDRRLMSGRLYIWSQYISLYSSGSELQLLFGRGPDSYQNFFSLYAHNTLIGYLFELGMLGAMGILGVWGYYLSRAVMSRGEIRVELIAGHVGFLILNTATMPHWLIEGNIFYGMVCGFSIAAYRRTVMLRRRPPGQWHPRAPVAGWMPGAPARERAFGLGDPGRMR